MKNVSKAALVVVDVQNDFCPGGALAVENGDHVVPLINRLLKLNWGLTVASLDWHPRNHVSFASNHVAPNNKPFESTIDLTNPAEPNQVAKIRLWPDHCVAGTSGAALVEGLDVSRIQHQVEKGADPQVEMYSCLGSVWGLSDSSEARLLLRQSNVNHVYVVGLAGDYCVKHTALHAARAGFATTVLRDATRSICGHDSEEIHAVEAELEQAGVKVAETASLFE